MKSMTVYALLVAALVDLTGCDGRPMYPFVRDSATPGNHLETKRGGRMQLDLNSNATAKMTGLRVKKSLLGGTADIDYLEISQDVVPYWAGSNQAMLNYVEQQKAFVPILDAHYAGLTKLIPAILHEVAPLLLPWIQARGAVDLQNAMRPRLVEQIARGLSSNLFSTDLLKGALNPLDPTLVQEVINKAQGVVTFPPISDAAKRNEAYLAQMKIFNEQIAPAYNQFREQVEQEYRATEDSKSLYPSEPREKPRTTRAAILRPEEIGTLERRS